MPGPENRESKVGVGGGERVVLGVGRQTHYPRPPTSAGLLSRSMESPSFVWLHGLNSGP